MDTVVMDMVVMDIVLMNTDIMKSCSEDTATTEVLREEKRQGEVGEPGTEEDSVPTERPLEWQKTRTWTPQEA